MKKDFLLEIGCENLPSGYIDGAIDQLTGFFEDGFKAERLNFDSLYVTGTPNRLVGHVQGLPANQPAREEQVVGPPISAALDGEGNYTRAAAGFAERQGVPVGKLSRIRTERGEYLALVKKIKGKSTVSLLKEYLPRWISSIKFPKTMKWDDSGFRFARPVRWIMAYLGDKPLIFKTYSLDSKPVTRLSPYFEECLPVRGIEHYYSLLRENRVILDQKERRRKVEELAAASAAAVGGTIVEDEDLSAMVANLIESPVAMAGDFDKSFLKLPREVIITALKSHQRYFSVQGKGGKLKSNFIAFADGARKNKGEILKGYERVLQARLADAEFYYREDTSRPIEEMAGKLEGVVWLEGLGTLAGKSRRIGALSRWLVSSRREKDRGLDGTLARAAFLAKADVASEMVKDGKEFTMLQGYIGREYALVSGENRAVAEAIFEHYLPRFAGDEMPATPGGIYLSIADKLDTISGCFIQGLEPTGSQDPYALRRNAMGILRMLIEKELPVSLPAAIARSLELFAEEGLVSSPAGGEELGRKIEELFAQRFYTILRSQELDHDLITAVLAGAWELPGEARKMVMVLQDMRKSGTLTDFVLAMKRITNIIPPPLRKKSVSRAERYRLLEGLASGRVDELHFDSGLFEKESEGKLLEEVSRAAVKLVNLRQGGNRFRCFDILAGIVPAINRYFDEVLVNCENKRLRENRLFFLLNLWKVFGIYCNYSDVSGE
ncbi:MAG: glycine--tRNA ligase subunit beta [Candidatus Krumholzibacteriota bacterium]|nr:glycine--tRNA ligase subunit beta [Candidatus Krumholzibacteriota bacterium]